MPCRKDKYTTLTTILCMMHAKCQTLESTEEQVAPKKLFSLSSPCHAEKFANLVPYECNGICSRGISFTLFCMVNVLFLRDPEGNKPFLSNEQ